MDNNFYRKEKKKSRVRELLLRLLRNRRVVVGLLIGLPLLLALLFSDRGILKRIALEREKVEMTEKLRQAEEETKKLQAESKALDGDARAIEKVAREKYGMVREGEKLYKVNKE